MRKALTITKGETAYVVTDEVGTKVFEIPFDSKELSSSLLYQKVYQEAEVGKECVVTIAKAGENWLVEDNHIFDQIKGLLDDVNLEISKIPESTTPKA
jgi:hypothetical protein